MNREDIGRFCSVNMRNAIYSKQSTILQLMKNPGITPRTKNMCSFRHFQQVSLNKLTILVLNGKL